MDSSKRMKILRSDILTEKAAKPAADPGKRMRIAIADVWPGKASKNKEGRRHRR